MLFGSLINQLQAMVQWMMSEPLDFFVYTFSKVIVVLVAITFHEVAHGYVAYRCGDPTAKMLGRLSLNPLKHLDPIGTITLFLLGFGWAKPVPVNPRNFRNFRRDDFLVSVAGITVNFSLFIIATALMVGIQRFAYYSLPMAYLMQFLAMLSSINLGLGVFNLIPIPPLDGFHLLNDTLLKGRLRLQPQFFQIAQVALIALVFMGAFDGILRTVITAINNGVLNLFLRMTGA